MASSPPGSAPARGRVHPRALLAATSVIGLAAGACAARINNFTVTPHEVCPATHVKVDWNTDGGSARITTNPPLSPQSDRTYSPTATTQFIITVKPFVGKPKSKETAVTVYTGTTSQPEPSEIGFNTRCEGSSVSAALERPPAEWDPKITVGSVASDEGRAVTVTHEGRQTTLTAQQPRSNAFDGTKLGGSWSVTVPLLPTEGCEGSGAKPPNLIILTANVRCGS